MPKAPKLEDELTEHSPNKNAVDLIKDAMANIRANAGKAGLTPQQARSLVKLETASRLMTCSQQKPLAK